MKECEYWNLSLFNPESLIEVCEFMEIDRIKLDLKLDELVVLNYLFRYIFISNKVCREELGFGKTKSAYIFKKLVKLGLVDRHGAGPSTYYMLKQVGYTSDEEAEMEY